MMIITAPTAEQFMSLTEPDEDEAPSPDALASIAHSLDRMLAIAEHHELEESEADRWREAHDDLDAKAGVMLELIEEIEAIVKPSTSKLANSVREALDRWRGVEPAVPAEQPGGAMAPQCPTCQRYFADGELLERHVCTAVPASPPAHDTPIEEWVAYAQAQGHDVDPGRTNRSQIRTLLGLPHPAAEA